MHLPYDDILKRIDAKPIWWLNAVPRFNHFHPDDATISASRVLLVHTKCVCGTDYLQSAEAGHPGFMAMLAQGSAGFGDPPNACHIVGNGGCSNFATCCREIRVLQCWERLSARERRQLGRSGLGRAWKRVPEHEIELVDWQAE